jgi:hypothetical protein
MCDGLIAYDEYRRVQTPRANLKKGVYAVRPVAEMAKIMSFFIM